MARKYNQGNKSSMRRYMRDLEKRALKNMEEQAYNMERGVECPSCGENIKVKGGKNTCKYCGASITDEREINNK